MKPKQFSILLIGKLNLGASDLILVTKRNIENSQIQVAKLSKKADWRTYFVGENSNFHIPLLTDFNFSVYRDFSFSPAVNHSPPAAIFSIAPPM